MIRTYISKLKRLRQKSDETTPKKGLGTFNGVYLPSVLTIFGVIMYLRLGYILGSVGLIPLLSILILASTVTFITACSIAATSTNMHVGGGGTYFLISRCFGKEVGCAVGVPMVLAQIVGIAFYLAGFAESVHLLFPDVSMKIVGISALVILTILASTSSSLAVKTQTLIFLLILGSLFSFFSGASMADIDSTTFGSRPMRLGYWAAFALFFPAVTGIEAGVGMSGDLRDPGKSLPRGTILAVLTGLVTYLVISIVLYKLAPREVLLRDPHVVQHISRWEPLVIAGIWGATLSSALGAIMAAPRTLQALALDGVLPDFLAKTRPGSQDPLFATIVTGVFASGCIWLGSIDAIAPVLAMFFLITYGLLNLSTGFESLMQNPSWRPTFRVAAWVPLTGAGLSIFAMLMIDAGATFMAFAAIALLYILVKRRLSTDWDDIRQGILFFFSRQTVYRLATAAPSPRAWRPHFLVFTKGFSVSPPVLGFTTNITYGKGFLTVASLCGNLGEQTSLDTVKKRVAELFKRKKVQAIVEVSGDKDDRVGIERYIEYYGLGPLTPNTVVIAEELAAKNEKDVFQLLNVAQTNHKNVVVVKGQEKEALLAQDDDLEPAVIDVWWDDDSRDNSELMLVLAHMHQSSKGYNAIKVNLKSIVHDESAREQRKKYFIDLFAKSRLKVDPIVYVVPRDDSAEQKTINHFSSDADLVLIGLNPPADFESAESYGAYYRNFLKAHKNLSNVAYVLASEHVELNEIFS